jgi:predicted TIM-barrel fold metal-dependent hydrolase
MIDGMPVIDAVVHGFDWNPYNMNMEPGKLWGSSLAVTYRRSPRYASYMLEAERAEKKHTAEEMLSTMFAESQTDVVVYHVVRRIGIMNEGEWSPLDVAAKLRDLAGQERVKIMAGLSDPFDLKRCIDELDEQVEQHDVVGLKLYPLDWDSQRQEHRPVLFSDEDVVWPILNYARERGLRLVAVHKAYGHLMKEFGVGDMDAALDAFPDMQFEIVHGGWAFLDDTAILATRSNVWINLEGTISLLVTGPRRFAHTLGRFITAGSGQPNAGDRVVFGSGAMGLHPRPLIELFREFQMPRDLVEGYGYPELTDELKAKILGGNIARRLGTTAEEMVNAIPATEMRKKQLAGEFAPPWSAVTPRDDAQAKQALLHRRKFDPVSVQQHIG